MGHLLLSLESVLDTFIFIVFCVSFVAVLVSVWVQDWISFWVSLMTQSFSSKTFEQKVLFCFFPESGKVSALS